MFGLIGPLASVEMVLGGQHTMENDAEQREKFLAGVRSLFALHRDEIEAKKQWGQSLLTRDDVLWYLLIMSHATWGRDQAAGLVGVPENYDKVRYQSVGKLIETATYPAHEIADILYASGVTMRYRKKGSAIVDNYSLIERMGGIAAANARFLSIGSWDEMIVFLGQFEAIGQKYQRNIPMDVYHPEFRRCIAIDARILTLSKALGLPCDTGRNYGNCESFFVGIADEVPMEPWELDRLLYRSYKEIMDMLK
jgi:hypothetical protein